MEELVDGSGVTRRDFLRLAAGGALLATGAGCGSGSDTKPAAKSVGKPAAGRPTLRIAQWNHYVAGYDAWWDNEYTKQWGERNGVEVTVDHFDVNQAPVHAEAEVASRRGHDLFQLQLGSPASFEDHVIDHREIVEEVEAKVGKMASFLDRSISNHKTGKYFALSDHWTPSPAHYRTDLWGPTGLRPDTWEDILAAGSSLQSQGHPVGIGMSDDLESNVILMALMESFGARVQDEAAGVVVNRPATVEAVKFGAALFRSAMTDEVLGWDIASNNRYLVTGRGSLILNAIAALRALEAQDPVLASTVGLLPVPAGPSGRSGPYVVSNYFIWKFSENKEAAKQFLVDLASDHREPFLQSQFLQLPSFPGAVAGLADLVAHDRRAQPEGKYALLAGAADWTTNVGHPGHMNAAIDEVVKTSIISQMFATAARGEMTAEEAVGAAEARIKPIYDRWREQGKI